MRIEDFAYDLPESAIAQVPLDVRDSSRLLVSPQSGQPVQHLAVSDIASLVGPGDVIVVNNTRVLPARLALAKPTGGAVEVFLLEEVAAQPGVWEALVRPSRKVPEGMELRTVDGTIVVVAGADLGEGRRHVHPASNGSLESVAARYGSVPTPPYVTAVLEDPERYQTVYAEREVSVAAPTAGLHFTPDLLAACERAGARVMPLELAVGIGTFRPITVDKIDEHEMHAERYAVGPETWEACQNARRVIAIGTTTTRALESAATFGQREGNTNIFISPGYEWKVVDTLLTNFHQPRSSLLVMLAAFVGPRWRELYAEALAEGYRFLSFGDAMLVSREGSGRA